MSAKPWSRTFRFLDPDPQKLPSQRHVFEVTIRNDSHFLGEGKFGKVYLVEVKGNFYAVKIVDSCIKLFAEFNAWPQHLELEALPAEEANFLPFYAVGAENPPGIGAAIIMPVGETTYDVIMKRDTLSVEEKLQQMLMCLHDSLLCFQLCLEKGYSMRDVKATEKGDHLPRSRLSQLAEIAHSITSELVPHELWSSDLYEGLCALSLPTGPKLLQEDEATAIASLFDLEDETYQAGILKVIQCLRSILDRMGFELRRPNISPLNRSMFWGWCSRDELPPAAPDAAPPSAPEAPPLPPPAPKKFKPKSQFEADLAWQDKLFGAFFRDRTPPDRAVVDGLTEKYLAVDNIKDIIVKIREKDGAPEVVALKIVRPFVFASVCWKLDLGAESTVVPSTVCDRLRSVGIRGLRKTDAKNVVAAMNEVYDEPHHS